MWKDLRICLLSCTFGLEEHLEVFFFPSSKIPRFAGSACPLTTVTNQFLLLFHSQLLCGNSQIILEAPSSAGIPCCACEGAPAAAWPVKVCAKDGGAEAQST